MRIQHNIMAMNAYRNYTNNTSALAKNLEKLSSGYRINRAGDDAAGLAISEKMRAQITGLSAAQKNVKDGISLVKTAEGATQEIHDMLNRMVYLAEQSANGTYQDEVDREAITSEFEQLKSEINRIADSSNFNGIKLLDGSLSSTGKASSSTFEGWDSIKGALAAGITEVKATNAQSTILMGDAGTAPTVVAGDKLNMTLTMTDGSKHDIELTVAVDSADKTKFNLVDKDGNELITGAAANAIITDANLNVALGKAISNSDLGKEFSVDTATAKSIILTAKEAGAGHANVASVDVSWTVDGAVASFGGTNKAAGPVKTAEVVGADKYEALDLSQAKIWHAPSGDTDLSKCAFEINGEKFVFIENGEVTDERIAEMREAGVEHWIEVAASDTIDGVDIKGMVEKIKHSTGLDVKQGTVDANSVWADGNAAANTHIKIADGASSKQSGGLTLQIGDTSDDYNQLSVSIKDMHTKALGLDGIFLGNQKGAADAVNVIKDAINYVSDVRGTLGATQNRLEHTANNLSVMQENIQDAEASIRDTDVAEEMMAYTKNNILVQSAQAMLAQANQVPQGVLQLLG